MDMEIWYLKIKFVAQFAIDGFELLRAKKILNRKYIRISFSITI